MRAGRMGALLVLAAMVAGASASSASADVSVTNQASGLIVYIAKGDTLTTTLSPADSGSSGFHWAVANKPSRSSLRLRSSATTAKGQVLTFTGRRVGYTRLRVEYRPPGRHHKAAKVFVLNVVVNPAEPKLTCSELKSSGGTPHETIVRNSVAVAFSVHRSALVYHRADGTVTRASYHQYYGCELARDRAVPLLNRGAEPAHDVFYNLTLSGGVLGYVVKPACPFSGEFECGGTEPARVESIDLHTGKLIRSAQVGRCGNPDCPNDVTGLVMSPAGGLAWIEGFAGQEPFSVHRSDLPAASGDPVAHDNEEIGEDDPGTVDPDSLHYDGSEFTWVRGGKVQRAPLR